MEARKCKVYHLWIVVNHFILWVHRQRNNSIFNGACWALKEGGHNESVAGQLSICFMHLQFNLSFYVNSSVVRNAIINMLQLSFLEI